MAERVSTYPFALEAFDNGKGTEIVNVLHDEPRDGFAVTGVDARGFREFSFEAWDRVRVIVCVEVNGDSVYHDGRERVAQSLAGAEAVF